MKSWFALLLAFLATNWTHGSSVNWTPNVTFNIHSAPMSGTCDNSADDTAAFNQFNTTALAYQAAHPGAANIELDLNQGDICLIKGTARYTYGIASLHVVGLGTGATISDNGTGTFTIGGGGGIQNGQAGTSSAVSARIATVAAGATSITIPNNLTACATSCSAMFNVGDWALITGIDMQGAGAPPNPPFWDWVHISAVSGTGTSTGTITFTTTPLTYTYKSTWPSYFSGSIFNPDLGGPATIYQIDQKWVSTQEFNNLTFNWSIISQGQGAGGQNITLRNVTITGDPAACTVPSVNQNYNFIDVTATSCSYEIDKIIDNISVRGSHIHAFDFQSSSVKTMSISGSTFDTLNGTARTTTISNSTITNTAVGPHSFGYAKQFTGLNSNLGVISGNSSSSANINVIGTWVSGTLTIPNNQSVTSVVNNAGNASLVVASSASYSTGILTTLNCGSYPAGVTVSDVPDSTHIVLSTPFIATCTGGVGLAPDPGMNWAVPGNNVYFQGREPGQGPVLQVADLTQDVTGIHISFNLNGVPYTGGFPLMAMPSGSNPTIYSHPSPIWNCTACTGSDLNAADLSNPGAQGVPMWSYSKRTITQATGAATSAPTVPVWGLVQQVNQTVNVASNAAGTMNTSDASSFVVTLNSTAGIVSWDPQINAKLTGTCSTAQPLSGSSGTGGQTGCNPSLPSPGANTWLPIGQWEPGFSSAPAGGDPVSVDIEVITNQGVVPPP